MPPAARVTDMHTCPLVTGVVPHVGGPIIPPCCPTVIVGGMPQARVTDIATCVGPPDMIAMGSTTVFVGGLPAARMGDMTAHGGVIVSGFPTVMIGDGGGGSAQPSPAETPANIAAAVNPTGSTINCGFIIDAVVARLRGTDPKATAPNQQDGSFSDIEKRFSTTIQWNQTMQGAFDQVQAGGNGTTAIIGIQYGGGGAHVITMVNDNGTVGIVEGQTWDKNDPAGFITDPAIANARYNPDGKSNIGVGVVPK